MHNVEVNAYLVSFIYTFNLNVYLLSFAHIPYEHMLAGSYSHIAALLSSSQPHEHHVRLLTADQAEHCAGHVAQVLLRQPHDQDFLLTYGQRRNVKSYHSPKRASALINAL